MKKILLIAGMFAIGIVATAQEKVIDNSPRYNDAGNAGEVRDLNAKSLRRDPTSGWYLPINWLQAASSNPNNWSSFVSLMFPDSSVFNIDNTSTTDTTHIKVGHNDHSWGFAFDPVDELIAGDPNGLAVYSRHMNYSWDSLYFRYGYVRQIDSIDKGAGLVPVVDTLIVRYYTFSTGGLTTGTLTGGGLFGNVNGYNASLRYAPTAFKTDRIRLTSADSTSRTASGWLSNQYTLPVNQNIPSGSVNRRNNLFGFTVHFKPGTSYSFGDTLIDLTDAQNIKPVKKHNYFLMRFSTDNNSQTSQVPTDKNYNNALKMSKFTQYTAGNGWLGYIPGNAFFQNQYLDCGFFASSTRLSVNGLENKGITIGQIYPNPANGSNVIIPVTFINSNLVTISIIDVTGKVISTSSENVASGKSDLAVNTNGLSTGVYTINVSVDGISTAQKIMIN